MKTAIPPANKVIQLQKRSKKRSKILSAEQQELVDIRQTLDLSQHVFAELLAIGSARLTTYENGITEGVPEHILVRARKLLENNGMVAEQAYGSMDMPEIIAEWATTLDIDYDDDLTISNFIGATVAEISRWKSLESRPSPLRLEQFRNIVNDIKERMGQSDFVRQELKLVQSDK